MADYRNITAEELQTMLERGGVRLLDVRTDAEQARGRIPQAEAMPLHMLPFRMRDMDRDATLVLYCQMGGRSEQAAAFMAGNGFVDVCNLQGGLLGWAQAGGKVA